jgi:transcriptional antiterminator NusG
MKTGVGAGDDSEGSRERLQPGDTVRVMDGPFKDFSGAIDRVDPKHTRLIVEVLIFGRKSPVELTFQQVKRF